MIQSTSSIKDTDIQAENILGGHSRRIYFDLPKEYNKKILDIVSNGNTSYTVYSSQIISLTSGTPLGSYDEAVYPRFAATHGVEENEGKIIEKMLSANYSGYKGVQNFLVGNSTHYGVDFVQKDEEKIVNDGTVGHLYINMDSTKNRSAIGFGLEGFAPMTGDHSMSGGADRYSAFGGPKYYVKIEKEAITEGSILGIGGTTNSEMKGNSKDYINDICKEYNIQGVAELENKILKA